MNELEQTVYDAVVKDHDHVVQLRRWLHAHPELPKEEVHTQEKIEEELHAIGLETKRIAGTGVYAEIKGEKGEGKTIVLRADIDALPVTEVENRSYASVNKGVMHACGHDAHTSSLIGAARVLASHRELFPGKVVLTFQPGEEIGYGARVIVDEGDIDGADRTFGCHMKSALPAGTIAITPGANNASVDQFRIDITGKSAHITTPNLGIDAAAIASQIILSSQTLINKRVDPMNNILLGIGHVEAGTAYNIIADHALIEGTLRTFDEDVRAQVLKEFEALVKQTAAMYGGSAEFWRRNNTDVLNNDPVSTAEAQKTAIALFGKDHVITDLKPSLGGDDMATYINKVPGVYCYVGSGNEAYPDTTVAHHNCRFNIDEDALRVCAAIYAAYAVDYLNGLV
ncbi:MAG: amidohydrolase [Bulleidia sp.]|nr:amidohydrolase [Bulleidia sp.]